MESNPLAAIEFVLFIGFAVWLVMWQRSTARRSRDEAAARERDAGPDADSRDKP